MLSSRTLLRWAVRSASLIVLTAGAGQAQVVPQGMSQGSTQIVAGPVFIDMATGSMLVRLSVREKGGGIPFQFNLINNSGNQGAVNNYQSFSGVMSSGEMGGFGIAPFSTCGQPLNTTYQWGNGLPNQWYVIDDTGARHPFTFPPIRQGPSNCAGSIGPLTSVASDGSGYTAVVTGSQSINGPLTWVVYNKEGMSISSSSSLTDADGNTIYSGANGWVDTLGQTAVTGVYGGNLQTGGHSGNPDQYYYTDVNGTKQYYTVAYASQHVKTVFTCTAPQGDIDTNLYLPSTITTPTGAVYVLTYESTPGYPGDITGRIGKLTLPSGGYVAFTYGGSGQNVVNGYDCVSGVIPQLQVTISDNNGNTSTTTYVNNNLTNVWEYGPTNFTVTETDPLGDVITHNLFGEFEEQRIVSDVNQGVLSTTITCYNGNFTNCPSASISNNSVIMVTQTDVYTQLGSSGPWSLVEKTFDNYGNTTSVSRWDWGLTVPNNGAPTVAPTTKTTTSYDGSTGSCGTLAVSYMRDRPCSVTTVDSSGNTVSQTNYTYNSTGHPIQTSSWISGSTYATSSATFNANGTPATATDANGNVTTFKYDGSCNSQFPTSTVHPTVSGVTPTTYQTWDCNGGVLTSATDANGNKTTYSYVNPSNGVADPLWRQTRVTYPDTGTSTTTYSTGVSLPWTLSTSAAINSSTSLNKTTIFDGLGRVTQTQLTSDPQGVDYEDTTYDLLGRRATLSNPHRSTSSPTDGITSYTYDALDRILSVLEPDGSRISTNYANNCSTVTDEAGKSRQACVDGLGRTTGVWEDPGSAPHLNYETDYTYDALGNLLSVNQKGASSSPANWRTRTFTYDGVSRLSTASNPESGKISYTYDANGNLITKTSPAPNQDGVLGTGSVTFSGTLQSKQVLSQAATSGTGSVTFSGALQSKQVQTGVATPGTGTVTISGTEGSKSVYNTGCRCLLTIYDAGTVSITVNGRADSTSYARYSTSSTIASGLVSAVNADSAASVTASASGSTVTLTAKTTGSSTNYSLSASVTSQTGFSPPSFAATPSGSTLTGGTDATYTTVYDSGTSTITINGHNDSVSWSGSGTTTSSIASGLASAINADSAASVSASASGTTVNLTAKTTGASTNYSMSSSWTYDSADFSRSSFTSSNSGSTLSGGKDAVYNTIYDSGTGTITVNGYNNTVSWSGSGTTSSSIASALASNINGDSSSAVTATVSGSTVNLTAKTPGPNYSLSSSSTYDSTDFSSSSFTSTNSGSSLTGGIYPSGTTVTAAYCYDALNRIASKAYTSSTACPQSSPVATYLYDQTSYNGLAITNGIGRRTGMADAAGLEARAFDSMGRPIVDQRTSNGVTETTTYTYNFDGSEATLSYPSGRIITYSYNGAARPVSAVDLANGINYATGAAYAPTGALSSLTNGSGIVSTFLYNNRLQPCWSYVSTSSNGAPTSCTQSGVTNAAILDYQYNFSLGSADNGNVIGIANRRDNTRSQNFTYDVLNRIATAQTQTSGVTIPNSNCWGLTFGYDAWSNLLTSSITGPSGCSEPLPMNASTNTSNQIVSNTTAGQITNYCYDAAGNLIFITQPGTGCPTSGPYQYSYNSENKMTSAGGATYLYDGDDRRVQKSNTANPTLYWYGIASTPLDETDLNGSLTNTSFHEYIFFAGRRIARRDYQNNVNYYFADHLGTNRVSTNSSGSVCYDADFYPFGGERMVTDTCDSAYKFTGKERDAESGLDNFAARYDSSIVGRFLSPDPRYFQASMLIDPQLLNLYAYVRNNPLKWVDPFGETLFLAGDRDWLTLNVLFELAGGEEAFNDYFHVDANGQVVLNEGVSREDLDNSGQGLIYDLVTSADNYVFFAGTSGADAAALFQGTAKKNGKLNSTGRDVANEFTCGGGRTTSCGTVVGTLGRPSSLQPANLANGDPVFAVIAYNTGTVQTEDKIDYGTKGYVNPEVIAAEAEGLHQTVRPVSLFIHESEENLAFRMQLNGVPGTFDYPSAHLFAIDMEAIIRRELKIAGGFAGAEVKTTVPH